MSVWNAVERMLTEQADRAEARSVWDVLERIELLAEAEAAASPAAQPGAQPGVLRKRTHHADTISLEIPEFKALERGEIQRIEVEGPGGKHMATVPGPALWQAIVAGKVPSGLRQVRDDPAQKAYYYVGIRRFMR